MCHTIHEYGFPVMVYGELTGDVNLGASTEQPGWILYHQGFD